MVMKKASLKGQIMMICVPRDSFHYSFRFGVFDLRYEFELCVILYHVAFRTVLDEQNLSHPYNYTSVESR